MKKDPDRAYAAVIRFGSPKGPTGEPLTQSEVETYLNAAAARHGYRLVRSMYTKPGLDPLSTTDYGYWLVDKFSQFVAFGGTYGGSLADVRRHLDGGARLFVLRDDGDGWEGRVDYRNNATLIFFDDPGDPDGPGWSLTDESIPAREPVSCFLPGTLEDEALVISRSLGILAEWRGV